MFAVSGGLSPHGENKRRRETNSLSFFYSRHWGPLLFSYMKKTIIIKTRIEEKEALPEIRDKMAVARAH